MEGGTDGPSVVDLIGGSRVGNVSVPAPVRIVEVAIANLDVEGVGRGMGLT